ncbi:RpiR family transcriptional regulator [Burkholderia cenocepacia]
MKSYPVGRSGDESDQAFRKVFTDLNWQIAASNSDRAGELVIVDGRGSTYLATAKTIAEGRPDRVVALFAQALLEARSSARRNQGRPAVLIWVKTASPSLVKRIQDFHDQHGDGEAFGLISDDGVQFLDFPGVSREVTVPGRQTSRRSTFAATSSRLVFSDRAQWMLKLLLAPEIPVTLLTAQREHYRTATDLARAAGVSTMTASRFVNALTQKGFLDRSSPYMKLVMRRKLAELWKAVYKNQSDPVPAKFLVPGPSRLLTDKLLQRHQQSLLGLFAAADALALGHVHGIPPYVYVEDMVEASGWKELRSARAGEKPDILLQQIRFPQSIRNGAVRRDGVQVTDILQVWLDVSAHPARGAEQAAELEHGVLASVI